ncbi:hypothetical protein ACFL34_00235 [Candidatus Sumerlaeota bacterium]
MQQDQNPVHQRQILEITANSGPRVNTASEFFPLFLPLAQHVGSLPINAELLTDLAELVGSRHSSIGCGADGPKRIRTWIDKMPYLDRHD